MQARKAGAVSSNIVGIAGHEVSDLLVLRGPPPYNVPC